MASSLPPTDTPAPTDAIAPGEPPAPRSPSLRGLLWPVLLSLAVLGAVFYATWEPDTLARMAEGLNAGLLGLAFGAVGVRILLGGSRLRYISHGTISLVRGMRGAVAWDFMSAVTPSAVGGAPLAAYFVAKDNRVPVGEATAIMLFSMLMDQIWFAVSIPFILLASAFIDVFPPALGIAGTGTLTAYFIGMMAWACFFAYATLIRPEILERAATGLVRLKWLRRFEGRVRRELVELRRRAAVLRGQPPRFFVAGFLWSAAIWLTRYTTLLLIVLSVYPLLDRFTFLVRTGAMILTAMAVPTPGGSGGIEGLYVLFLAPLIPKAIVGPTLLTWRLMAYHFFIAVGFVMTALAVKRRFGQRSDEPRSDTPPNAAPPNAAPRNEAEASGVEAPTPPTHA